MAARQNVHRRDFLRTLGAAAGITIPEATGSDAAASAPAVPDLTPTVPTAPDASATPNPPATPDPTATPDVTASPDGTAAEDPAAVAPDDGRVAAPAGPVIVPVIPTAADRHLLSRFSYGVTQALLADTSVTGASAWFEDQLTPDSIPDAYADGLKAWWPNLSWSPKKCWDEAESHAMESRYQQADFQNWTMLRRIYSKRQVHETMAEFWSNLLYIPAPLSKAFPHRLQFDDMIREHALGRFDEMLEAAILHPSMLCYLDNARSTFELVNENLGRELLELHTVGREAAFTEEEVADSALILTGWHVDTLLTWEATYEEADHYVGRVSVLGFTSPNSSPDGQQVARDYLNHLANHSATAARIARRLAVRFVSETPSDALVDHLAGVFTDSGTDIKATLRALVAHAEFKAAAGLKVRTPMEDAANTFRVLEVDILPPGRDAGDTADSMVLVCGRMGQEPYSWPRPDGFPDVDDAWSSASRALGSWGVHRNASSGGFPNKGAVYKPDSYWLPTMPIRFDAMVNYLSQRLLGQPANAQLQRTAAKAVDVLADEYVLPTSIVVTSRMPVLLVALLDTPQHMMR